MPKWNLKDLEDYIQAERTNSKELLEIAHSIDRYISIFLFHLVGARDAMNEIVDPNDKNQLEAMKIVFGDSEHQEEYELAKVASEAHILGVAHSARAMFDVFAFLVNGLLLNGTISEKRCEIKLVTKKLAPSPLKSELEALVASYWFGYVSAFVNIAKHRMLVSHSFQVGIGDPYTGIQIGSFEYEGCPYSGYKVREFLEGVLVVKNKIMDCGDLLNNQLVHGGG